MKKKFFWFYPILLLVLSSHIFCLFLKKNYFLIFKTAFDSKAIYITAGKITYNHFKSCSFERDNDSKNSIKPIWRTRPLIFFNMYFTKLDNHWSIEMGGQYVGKHL